MRPPIIAARAGDCGLGAPLLDSMYRLRAQVFRQRLGWDVRVEDGREHDWFDLIGPYYLVAHDGAQNALGCCRLLPSVGPNMLRDVFPSLLDGGPVPDTCYVPCSYLVTPSGVDLGYGSGTFAFELRPTPVACDYTASSDASWLTFPSEFRIGKGFIPSFPYSVAQNNGGDRVGRIHITYATGSQTFTVYQAGPPFSGSLTLVSFGSTPGASSWICALPRNRCMTRTHHDTKVRVAIMAALRTAEAWWSRTLVFLVT